MPEVVLRPAEEEDIAEMLALYAPYVVQTTVSSEYDAPSMEEFTRRWRTYTQKLPWLVCRIDGEVVGYGYAAPHRTRAAYQWLGRNIYLRCTGAAPPWYRRCDLRRAV